MLKILFFVLIFTFLLFSMELAVVVDRNFPQNSLTKNEIKAIFLNKKRFINGEKILVMNYKAKHPLRICFEKSILEKSKESLNRYWRKAYYQGKRPPKVISSSAMLFLYLHRVNPSIGYIVFKKELKNNVKIVFKIACDE